MIKISNFITYMIAGNTTQTVSFRSKDERLLDKVPRSLIPKDENYLKLYTRKGVTKCYGIENIHHIKKKKK